MMNPPEGLKPMSEAPTRKSVWLALWFTDKFGNHWPVAAHYAQNLSGEEQPAFQGWFSGSSHGGGWHQVTGEPIGWTTIEGSI